MATPANGLQRFTIFFQGRSGSTYLVEALDSHPRIRCEIEQLVGLRKAGPDGQLKWIEQFFVAAEEDPRVAAVGFKTKLDDMLDKDAVADLLRRVDAKVILLSRLNVMKMIVSWFNSERLYEATGDWNQYPPGSRMDPFEVDLEKFDRRLGLVLHGKARLEAYVRSLKLPKLQVCYEDLLTNEQRTLSQVCEFLGVEAIPLQGRCIKTTSDDLRHVVINYDELYARYKSTHYQLMLDEVLVPAEVDD
jgi:LPS sulfotransferase NodH